MASSGLITNTFKSVKNVSNRNSSKQQKVKDEAPSAAGSSDSIEDELTILKQFDLNLDFGPCVGITRIERWERAEKFGLNPPPEVKDILLSNKDKEEYMKCLWKDYELC